MSLSLLLVFFLGVILSVVVVRHCLYVQGKHVMDFGGTDPTHCSSPTNDDHVLAHPDSQDGGFQTEDDCQDESPEDQQSRQGTSCPPIVSRDEWDARPPKAPRQKLSTPVPIVIIHHTYNPPACFSFEDCKKAVQKVQNFHMDDRGWDDIGYNFLIGHKYVFEGRGWQAVGAQAKGFNNVSIGISLIGDYTEVLPPPKMLSLVKELIQCGIEKNYIAGDYKLIGHRQVRPTECPGEVFYKEIQSWDHWAPSRIHNHSQDP